EEDDAAHVGSSRLQRLSYSGSARHAVALAGEEQRCIERIESRAVDANELGYRLGVSARLIELRRVLRARGAAVPGTDRVDEHEVGLLQPRSGVRLDDPARAVAGLRPRWWRNALRPEADQMDERGVRAGPTVPGERDRAGRVAARAIERVR